MTKTSQEIRDGDLFPYWPQNSCRIEIYGTEGLMLLGRHGGGWQVFTAAKQVLPSTDGKVVAQEYGRFPDEPHKDDFLRCIASRALPNADIEIGHRSACLVHLANISYRVGRQKLRFDSNTERLLHNDEANRLLKREYRDPYGIPDNV